MAKEPKVSITAGDPAYTLSVKGPAEWPIVKFVKWLLGSSTVEAVFQFDRDVPLCRGCFIRIADGLSDICEVISSWEDRKIVLRTRKKEFDTDRQGLVALNIEHRLERCREIHRSRFA